MIVIRFFTILQRNWTYEVDYFLEITRMAFINLVFIIIPGILIRVFDSPSWVYIAILIPLAIFCSDMLQGWH